VCDGYVYTETRRVLHIALTIFQCFWLLHDLTFKSARWATRALQSNTIPSINGVVVTWVVATKWRAASTRRGFDSPLMHAFWSFLSKFKQDVQCCTLLYSILKSTMLWEGMS
jgi:hypothetical protein